jgi:hypothetical protein
MAVQFINQSVYPFVERIQAEADAAVLPVGAACVGTSSPACAPAVWLNTTLPARTGSSDFGLRCDRMQAGMPGAFLIGTPQPVGVPIADLVSFLGLDFTIGVPLVADAFGRAALPVSLAGVPAGTSLGLQTIWFRSAPCLLLLLQASHGLRIDVLP